MKEAVGTSDGAVNRIIVFRVVTFHTEVIHQSHRC